MDFRILGPIQVVEGQNALPLGGPKQRAVLAHLILRANRTVSAGLLIDEVWGEAPPPAVKSSLQSYVSHLRNALGPGRLEGRSGAYVLHAAPDEIDALRFGALVERARKLAPRDAASGVGVYEEAGALWRGRALEDLDDQPSLRPEITRLEELRLAAMEERIDAELDLGRHAELIPEMEILAARHPLRERLWGSLMTGLYRSGRQGDALGAFQKAREVLADELGIDPSSELQRLQEQILRQDPALEAAGEPLRGYRLLEQVGAGSFGSVHRAFQPQVGREVAVKTIHPRFANDPEFIRRFEGEAQLVARLEHPHVVPLYDFWREPKGAYLVMRYLRGGSLRERLAHGALVPQDAAVLLDQVALALGAAHRQGVVHRDVKPANILFDEDDNAYLTDFGIAKDLEVAEVAVPGGTPSPLAYYLSPEEVRGEPVTPRTDIYSLGVVLYEIVTGHHPFAEAPPEEVIGKHLREPLPPIRRFRPDLPGEIDGVIARATAKDPGERYPDAQVLASAFRAAAVPATARPVTVPAAEVRNPYKGLRPFVEADAGDYFGREKLVARLVGRMAEKTEGSRLLAVVGPSGSGKSSVVRAGLMPALRSGAVPGSDGWFVAEMLPGEQPFVELEGALLRVAPTAPPPEVTAAIEHDAQGLMRAAEWVLPDDTSELLLVIDQFEELFTLVDDEGLRARFLTSLAAAATDPRSRIRLIVTLRGDFYDRPLLYEGFGGLLHARTEVVVPLAAPELERAIVRPAERVGATVAPALVGQLIADVEHQPGALPLLQFTMTELFERRVDSTLASEAYGEIGGVSGGLARGAEEIFDSLSEEEKGAARQLFLRLVTLGEGTEQTLRRILRAELSSLHTDPSGMHTAIDVFGRARLLSFDRDPETRGPTVEVAHAALLREWNRLRGWIDAAREDLRIERWLATSARDWIEAGRDPSYLVSGSRLEQLEAWWEKTDLAIPPEERDFLEASLAERDRRQAGEDARRARERALERRSLRRLRALVGVLTLAAVVSGGLTVFASSQRGRAEGQERIAVARELAAAAVANLDEDPERSILLALEAVDKTRSVDGSVLPEAEEALHRAVGASRIELRVPDLGGGLDWSPRGNMFVTEGPEETGLVDIRDAATGESVLTFQGHDVDVNLVAFSDDGSMLATTGDDGAARVWDPATGRELWAFEGSGGQVWGPSFSPDGSLLSAAWWDEGVVKVWDLATGRMVHEIGPLEATFVTSFSPDGRRLAIPTWDSGAVVVDVGTGEKVFALRGQSFGVSDVDWSPDGRWIATSSGDSTIRIWEADTGKPRFTLSGHSAEVVAADWSPDSTHLVTGSGDGTAKVWEIAEAGTREVLSLPVQERGGGLWVAFSPDGERVMTGDQGITAVKIWDVSSSGDAEWANLPAATGEPGGVAFTPDGRQVVASSGAGSLSMWAADTAERSLKIGWDPASPDPSPLRAVDVSPDGGLIAGAGPEARVWDARTGEEVFTVHSSGGVEDVAWSPDGKLLATASFYGVVEIVGRSGREMSVLPGDPGYRLTSVRFSPDGRLLATGRVSMERADPTSAQVTIWDWEREDIVTRIQVAAEGLAFDPTGRRIATRPPFGPAKIWDVDSGRQLATLAGHTGAIFDIAFAPDGMRIGTASADGTVRLWDSNSGVQTLVLRGHESVVWDLAFSPDGSKLASSSPEGLVRVWALDLDDLIDIAERELTRGLTEAECRQYLHTERCA